MTLPTSFPDWIAPAWMPWWAQLGLLVLALLFAVAFLMMPFAVFGLKGRLDLLEAQLDDIHAELRMLAMRLPDPEPARLQAGRPARRQAMEPESYDEEPAIARRPQARTTDRAEPRVRWPPR